MGVNCYQAFGIKGAGTRTREDRQTQCRSENKDIEVGRKILCGQEQNMKCKQTTMLKI
jgi:hypothetical protein